MICHLCASESFEFLDLEQQPMANKYPKSFHEISNEEFYRVKVFFCPSCKNIQLDTTVSRETMFVDYYYLSSVNAALVKHYEKFAREKLKGTRLVVDVGSNDGILLKPLKEMGVKAVGIDPSENVGKIANASGLTTVVDFFNASSVSYLKSYFGTADVITGLSMFSHLQDPHQFIEDVKSLLTDDGRFIVEVEYNVEILKKLAFERFYLDRIFYFSVTSFSALFELHGMYVQDAEVTAVHGGSLRITAQKAGLGMMPNRRVKRYMTAEKKTLTRKKVTAFGVGARKQVSLLKKKLVDFKKKGLNVIGYGAPARLSTITNFGDIGQDLITVVIDDSALKQGRYSPGKHIPIVPASYLVGYTPDIMVVFAYDYFKDIKKKLPRKYRFLFPIPPREAK